MDAKTLRKHFRQDLDRGMTEATAKVAQSLFQMATTGKNVAAAIFWMKARAGWRKKQQVEIAGPDGQPLSPPIVVIRKFFPPVDGQEPGEASAILMREVEQAQAD